MEHRSIGNGSAALREQDGAQGRATGGATGGAQCGAPAWLLVLGFASFIAQEALTLLLVGVWAGGGAGAGAGAGYEFVAGGLSGAMAAGLTAEDALILQSLFFAAYLCSGLLVAQNSSWVMAHRRASSALATTAMLLAVLLLAAFALADDAAALAAAHLADNGAFVLGCAFFLLGGSCSFMHVAYLTCCTPRLAVRSERRMASAFLLGTLLVAAGLFGSPALASDLGLAASAIWPPVMLALAAVAGACACACLQAMGKAELSWIAASRQYSAFMTANAVDVGIQGFVLAFAIATVIVRYTEALPLAGGAMALGSAATLFAAIIFKNKSYDAAKTLRAVLPVLLALFLAASLTGAAGRILFCCAIIAIAVYAKMSRMIVGVVTNHRQHLNPITHYCYVPMPYQFGMMLGILYVVLFAGSAAPGVIPAYLLALLCTALMLLGSVAYRRLMTSSALRRLAASEPYAAHGDFRGGGGQHAYAEDNASAQEGQDGDASACAAAGIGSAAEGGGSQGFRARMRKLADDAQLTNKEFEVFKLLARGHNARHIANKLYVSVSTVKSHTTHIYAKMSVSSHQELLDIVDRRDDDSADAGS